MLASFRAHSANAAGDGRDVSVGLISAVSILICSRPLAAGDRWTFLRMSGNTTHLNGRGLLATSYLRQARAAAR
jgi:hypothetical protein